MSILALFRNLWFCYAPRLDADVEKRLKLVKDYKINVLLDVGANDGPYALIMRKLGYDKKIISFEPLKSAFEKLKKTVEGDVDWEIHNYALGQKKCKGTINVAGNSYSSSLLEMLPAHSDAAPESVYVGTEEVEIKTLDSIFNSFCVEGDKVMLKIDTQGYEKDILEGALNSLNAVSIIQLEMSMIPLYQGEILFDEMIRYLDLKGFWLHSFENGFTDSSSGRLLQVDGIFVKKSLLIWLTIRRGFAVCLDLKMI